ncbi:hypothetical protein SAMN05444372_10966 [Flavobacterium micromati]|jgi:hypothetical protein|uniref:Uncharacterized protein n=1 Tax=Flavobacterium micromati TaxID=229205 RepID=A0A1M5M6I7_9FLAO|nr:hypothetical protein SAMN05444372_10966 [Flavobacterium micromati]
MSQMNTEGGELNRNCSKQSNKIEYSTTSGRS